MNIYQLMLAARLNFSRITREQAIERIREKFFATSKHAFIGIDDNGDIWISSKPQTKSELDGWGTDEGIGEFVGTVAAHQIDDWNQKCHEVHLSMFDAEFL